MRNVIWQNLVLLLLTNIIIDVTNLNSGIYTNFRELLCKKCDVGYVGYYVINHGVTLVGYGTPFIALKCTVYELWTWDRQTDGRIAVLNNANMSGGMFTGTSLCCQAA